MAHRVVWSTRALADVEAIATYIASDSPSYANAVTRKIVALTRTLKDFPGPAERYRNSTTRTFVS
jgi:toxin ParE1/3/4